MGMEKGSGSITLLGAGASFEGKIKTPHTVQIYGKFNGEIQTNDSITIGRDGVVVADIIAKSAQVGGKVHGNITCKDQIELEEHSEVRGNITAKELVIKKGAVFHGQSSMVQGQQGTQGQQAGANQLPPPGENSDKK
ncbi:MAG: polymer-forming cytoskeletal protein [Chitinivibrionia bacterium]|jgi:cytoskeletal protein CcmA (bactofilin family)|nr:polymer-forming cytoskeletal protein [Chitinivibrionia bacterium]